MPRRGREGGTPRVYAPQAPSGQGPRPRSPQLRRSRQELLDTVMRERVRRCKMLRRGNPLTCLRIVLFILRGCSVSMPAWINPAGGVDSAVDSAICARGYQDVTGCRSVFTL